MNIDKFAQISSLFDLTEVQKVEHLAFYHYKISNIEEFTIVDLCDWFGALSLAKPNTSRLKKKLVACRTIVKGKSNGTFKLQAKRMINLSTKYSELDDTETIETINSILPKALYLGTRGYIEKLAIQINASFENNIYDGCAVIMRRLLEVLLILTYDEMGISSDIKDGNGEYKTLSKIISDAKTSSKLALSRNTKDCIESYRKIGNFSAHKIHYNAKHEDISNIALDFRAACEELLYKSGLKK